METINCPVCQSQSKKLFTAKDLLKFVGHQGNILDVGCGNGGRLEILCGKGNHLTIYAINQKQ